MVLPPSQRLSKLKDREDVVGYFGGLVACDLCLGCWVYFALCCFYGVSTPNFVIYVPVVSEAAVAAMFSFFSHIFFLGLKLKYGNFDL